ncbi:MAG: hypothetical protein HQ481_04645 [Alphaproteobacteria bacterium]|nr:hypothetical protein [Alphaproteobacteria bacterium]
MLSIDSGGRRFEYHRDVVRGPTLFLAAPTAVTQALAARVGGERLTVLALEGEAGSSGGAFDAGSRSASS